MDVSTLNIFLLILYVVLVAVVILCVYLLLRVNALSNAMDYLCRRHDYMEGEIYALVMKDGGYTGGSGGSAGADDAGSNGYEDDGK